MKAGQDYFNNKSSFYGVEKDLACIVKKFMSNQKLMKLLYYTQADCLTGPEVTPKEAVSMLNKQIKIVPQILIDESCPTYIIITFNTFFPNKKNPEFRDYVITIDILCHPDHWILGDFQLRPYKIAGEIDGLLDNSKLTGIGETKFIGGTDLLLDNQLIGLTLNYKVIHGVEDLSKNQK